MENKTLTNFRKVWEFHDSFELDINEKYDVKILDDKKLVKLRIDLIKEELNELFDAFINHDFTEVRDALGDIIYVVNGMGVSFGLDIDKLYKDYYDEEKKYESHSLFEITKHYNNDITLNTLSQVKSMFENKHINENPYIRYMKHILDITFNNLSRFILEKKVELIKKYTVNLIFNIHSLAFFLCIDLDHDFDLIHTSNMSKLCISEDEAMKTVEIYKTKYENNNSPYDSPAYKLSKNGKYYIVYNQSTNKILKSMNYQAVKLI